MWQFGSLHVSRWAFMAVLSNVALPIASSSLMVLLYGYEQKGYMQSKATSETREWDFYREGISRDRS
jgi:hypothetical protein